MNTEEKEIIEIKPDVVNIEIQDVKVFEFIPLDFDSFPEQPKKFILSQPDMYDII